MRPKPQPIFLFADSSLLFWRDGGNLLLDSLRRLAARDSPKAAYVGASNGDRPEFYSIFEAAMDGVGVHERRMIRRSFPAEERSFLNEADIILLAGGDAEAGWNVFAETGMREFIARRYDEGAVLIGISAGAQQLGLFGNLEGSSSGAELVSTFQLVPFVIDAHDEARGWGRLRRAVRLLSGPVRGVGIPAGGGMVYFPDQRVEAVRRPLHEFSNGGGGIREALLLPKRG